MKKLENFTNVTAPGGDFPYGDVKDNTGSNNGTPVERDTLSDMWQFIARLADKAGITPNDIVDNSSDGFQVYEAFQKLARPGKLYRALMSQTGTNAPTATVLGLNDVGAIVWTRAAVGQYNGTLTGAFLADKTFYQVTTGLSGGIEVFLRRVSDDVMLIDTRIGGISADVVLDNTPLEIMIYD